MGNCAGVDWAGEKHDVLIENPAGERLWGGTYAHDEPGVSALCSALLRQEVEVVAIERPDGLLVERLLETGIKVLALHPNQVKAARDRFRASGGKSDRFDAFVICELARTDAHRFRVLEPDSDRTNEPSWVEWRLLALENQGGSSCQKIWESSVTPMPWPRADGEAGDLAFGSMRLSGGGLGRHEVLEAH